MKGGNVGGRETAGGRKSYGPHDHSHAYARGAKSSGKEQLYVCTFHTFTRPSGVLKSAARMRARLRMMPVMGVRISCERVRTKAACDIT